MVIDWSQVDKEEFHLAMEHSPIKDVEIKVLLKTALTPKITGLEIYIKGTDQSYYYKEYNVFKTENITLEQ